MTQEKFVKKMKEVEVNQDAYRAGYQAGRESLLEELGNDQADTLQDFLDWYLADDCNPVTRQAKANEILTDYEDYLTKKGA